jgi:hypothetical protein
MIVAEGTEQSIPETLTTVPSRSHFFCPEEKVKLYLRRSFRFLNQNICDDVLDIATVEARYQGRGSFKRVHAELEQTAIEMGCKAIYVESVLDPRFATFLERIGYRRDGKSFGADGLPDCLFKLLPASNYGLRIHVKTDPEDVRYANSIAYATTKYPKPITEVVLDEVWPLWRDNVGSVKYHDLKKAIETTVHHIQQRG